VVGTIARVLVARAWWGLRPSSSRIGGEHQAAADAQQAADEAYAGAGDQ